MIQRINYYAIEKALSQYPIIAVTGSRQSGKTTMLKSIFSKYQYVNLENPDIRNYAVTNPRGFLSEHETNVIQIGQNNSRKHV